MPINASPHFKKAQAEYLQAETTEQKIKALKKMISLAPRHKGAENLRAELKRRLAKLKYTKEKEIKKKKASKKGIRKEGIQVVLCGSTNSGKSSLLSALTNASPLIAPYNFTTKESVIGTLHYQDMKFQIIDMPAINYETFNQSLANTADILLITITSIKNIPFILPFLEKAKGKRIFVFNKSDLLTEEEKRKISSYLSTKKYIFVLISCKSQEGIEELKEKLVENSGVIRIYTKEPGKGVDKEPIIMKPPVTIEDIAEKILKKDIKIKEIRVTGPSSKFPNQKVGLKHELKDKDVVEFHTI